MNKQKKYKSFTHRDCEYFPCHEGIKEENFNCLFCYCPLYLLGDECGGNFSYSKDGKKDCSACLKPHKISEYDAMEKRIKAATKKVEK